ncbi:hypothetical protein HanRHA438_Chr16g0750761 [Helianthus annuus]|nr:hypothetical protein HanIR_Chr16g0802881 [Helianthus annuus]KAJ0644197.1 hypothetical protein HanOQP8_Chr16g0609251 [Helianthus annuus]KAJ0820452.1 hypothetical protein HanPSC8_Chr16g0708201 [Helianthus annuus]KAJ0835058.1 hypothetical protein HanRHA438_Chr16g0750761 [Helianthus annuus]
MANFKQQQQQPSTLSKQRSWSPDINRDIEWQKLKNNQRRRFRHRRSQSIGVDIKVDVTDEDVKELKACFDLGFGFDLSADLDPKLASAFPALEFYAAVNRRYNGGMLSRSSSLSSDSSLSSLGSTTAAIVDPGDDPKKVKMKLKQWAQLVSCSILEASSQPVNNKNVAE